MDGLEVPRFNLHDVLYLLLVQPLNLFDGSDCQLHGPRRLKVAGISAVEIRVQKLHALEDAPLQRLLSRRSDLFAVDLPLRLVQLVV